MINKTILTGRLTKDVDLKHTSGGIAVAQFTVAIDRSYANKDGVKETDFINCVVWRGLAKFMAQNVHKGALVGIEGRLQTRKYDDKDGITRYVSEVNVSDFHFLESKKQSEQRSSFHSKDDDRTETHQKEVQSKNDLKSLETQISNSYIETFDDQTMEDNLPF